MKILLIYPRYPDTFWSFRYALKFISKKATEPPLGLLTVASMLPGEWEKKVIDLNVQKLKDKDIIGVDLVFISAMSIQRNSAKEIIKKFKEKGIKIVAGGPLFTMEWENFKDIDFFVL
ncbi:MAG: cobalamin-dependent protein, partial [Thermoanaerobaculia bacterium]